MSLRPLFLSFLILMCLLLCGLASAQTESATVSGFVSDPAGAAVVGAHVQITNVETNVSQSTTTNSAGLYLFPTVKPGEYRLAVTSAGFKEAVRQGLILHVQDTVSQNFKLDVGSVTETISVVADSASVNTVNASVSTVIDRQLVENLPLNGRSFNTLLQLTPGVVIAPSSSANGQPGQFSIAGQRTDANNFSVDGVSANFGVNPGVGGVAQSGTGNAQAFSVLGSTSSLVSVDSLQEFRIETSSMAPEFGRTPGGQVVLTTRSGTNEFHGGVFDYFRNTALDANDWFAKQAGQERAPEHHNDFGGFLGGPIWKNRTFYFLSYEGARLDLPQTGIDFVPSAYARSVAPPSSAPFLNAYPLPDDMTVVPGVYTSQFTGTYANRANLDAGSVRIDHTISDRFSVFGRYNIAPSTLVGRNAMLATLSTITTTEVNTQTLTVGSSMVFSSRIANSLRGNYSTQTSNQAYSMDSFGGAVPLPASTLFDTLSASQTYGYFYPFDANLAIMGPTSKNRTRQLNFVDDLTISKGPHQLKFGGDYRALFLDIIPAQNSVTLTTFTVQDFLTTGTANLAAETAAPSHILSQALSLYGQDTWSANPRLTLTFGVRWELAPAPSARGNTTLASWENVNNPAQLSLAPKGTSLWKTTFADFAPRFGLAYQLSRDGSLVLRAGGGVFYDLAVGTSAQLAVGYPNRAAVSFPNVAVPVTGITGYLPILSTLPPYPILVGISPDLVLPRSYQWNVAIEKSFRGKQLVSATYVGQAGRDLLRNSAYYQPNANFSSDFLLTGNDAYSNYDALELQYRKTLTGRLQALASYTWSHSLDNASDDVTVGLSPVVISTANDYASSSFDARHSFSAALNYAIPGVGWGRFLSQLTGNWGIDGVLVARSGFPFNAVVIGTSPDPTGIVLTRPDLVSGQPFWIGDSTAGGGRSLNPAAFSAPTTVRQGTERRNDIPGFGLTQIDLSISRKFRLTDHVSLQFRTDAFNVLNHPNFTNPLGYFQFGPTYLKSLQMLNQGLGGLNPLFQEGGPRSLQVSLRLTF